MEALNDVAEERNLIWWAQKRIIVIKEAERLLASNMINHLFCGFSPLLIFIFIGQWNNNWISHWQKSLFKIYCLCEWLSELIAWGHIWEGERFWKLQLEFGIKWL